MPICGFGAGAAEVPVFLLRFSQSWPFCKILTLIDAPHQDASIHVVFCVNSSK